VVEHLDGHSDIIHKKLRGDWLPWSGAGSILFSVCTLYRQVIIVYIIFSFQGNGKERSITSKVLEERR
jgi:hypothetical protein